MLDWLATDAHPDSPGGLARSTWDSYRSVASRHVIGNAVERELKKTGEIVEVEPAINRSASRAGTPSGAYPRSSSRPRTSSSDGYRLCARRA